MVTGGPAPLHSGCPAAPCRPGPCPVTGAWMRVSLGASQGQAACAEGSRCLISCDCPSSHVTGLRIAVLQLRTQTPGGVPRQWQVRACSTVGAEPALSHGDLGRLVDGSAQPSGGPLLALEAADLCDVVTLFSDPNVVRVSPREVGSPKKTKPRALLENCRDLCGLSHGMVGAFCSTDPESAAPWLGR